MPVAEILCCINSHTHTQNKKKHEKDIYSVADPIGMLDTLVKISVLVFKTTNPFCIAKYDKFDTDTSRAAPTPALAPATVSVIARVLVTGL